jgi:hypothetical protein
MKKVRALYGKRTEIKLGGFSYVSFYSAEQYVWIKLEFPFYIGEECNQVYDAKIARCNTKKQAKFLTIILNNIFSLLEN